MPSPTDQALADLARIQQSNQNNTWLTPKLVQDDINQTSIEARDRDAAATMPVGSSHASPSAHGLFDPLATPSKSGIPDVSMPYSPPVIDPKYLQPPIKEKKIPQLSIGGGSGHSTQSALQERYDRDKALRGEISGTYSKEDAVNQRNKELMQIGEDSAKSAQDNANALAATNTAKDQKDLADMQQKADQRAQSRQQQMAELRAAHVDPNHWFKERGTVGSILAAISVAAGAFAAAVPHTGSNQNFALGIINKSIEQDIDAQKDDIENKWKALNFQGSEDDKAYAHDQFVYNQKLQAHQKGLDHANALVGQIRTSTNNQVAISELDKLGTDIQRKEIELRGKDSEQMYNVKKEIEAKAAAAASANPYSATNLEKEWAAYVKQQQGLKLHPMPKAEWLQERIHGSSDASGTETQEDKNFQKGAQQINAAGEKAGAATIADDVLSTVLPKAWAPGSNKAIDAVNQYNDGLLPLATRLLGDRIAPDAIEHQIGAFKISPWMSDEQVKERRAAFQTFINTGRSVQLGAKKGTAQDNPGEVPGATPVGE